MDNMSKIDNNIALTELSQNEITLNLLVELIS